jgi:hypothetical protein
MQPKLLIILISLFAVALAFVALSITPQANAASTTSITITSSPSTGSGYVTVDGTPITTPATFNWNVGDNHTITANSTVEVVSGQSRYAYSNWSDNGTQTHKITVPSQTTTYTANYQLQYHLSVSGGNGIGYSNPKPGNWYDAGTATTISTAWSGASPSTSSSSVLWLPFDEGSGTTAHDKSGNGNNWAITGASWVDGKYGKALSFDGINDYVQIANPVAAGGTFTAAFWVKSTSAVENKEIINLNGGSGGSGIGVGLYPGGLLRVVYNGAGVGWGDGNTVFPNDGLWHFITLTRVGNISTLYLDLVSISTVNGMAIESSPTVIGCYGGGGFFSGIIDEVRFYNRTLSQAEITDLYNYRTAVTGWQLDGVDQSPARQGSGALTTSSITMSNHHNVSFIPVNQYYLLFSGGNNVTLSKMSPTGDGYYDMGSTITVTTNNVWAVANDNTRQNLFSYTLDGTTTNVTRADTGNFICPAIIFDSPRKLTFNSVTQYLVSFYPFDNSGTVAINPSSFQIEINDLGVISIPEFKMWLDNGTKFKIHAVIWENADVKPINNQLYMVNAPLDEPILNRVFNAKFAVTDQLGIPVSNAQVFFTFANGTTIQLTTVDDHVLSLGFIPIGTFHATISYLGTATEVDGDASTQTVTTGKVLASYPTFSLIGGGIVTAAVGFVLYRFYSRSPQFKYKVKGYIKVNWGAPFIVAFMLLLMVAAVSLSLSLSSLADAVAVYAYYALVIGVVLQLVCFLKYRGKNADETAV